MMTLQTNMTLLNPISLGMTSLVDVTFLLPTVFSTLFACFLAIYNKQRTKC